MTTTTTPATAAGTILALDLGKYKTVACAYDPGTAQARFDTLTTSRQQLRKLFARERPAAVVIEACLLAGWVHDLCHELGLACHVANTASEAWKFKHAKRKTDRDDALRLAQLYALGQLPTVVIPSQQTRPWRALIACRQALVGRRCAAQNRIRAVLVGQGLPAPCGAQAWATTGLQGMAQHARPLAEYAPDELWRGLLELALTEYRQARELIDQAEAKLDALAQADAGLRLLETIPGVGPRTAETVVAYLGGPGPLPDGQAGVGLRRAGAEAVPVGRMRPPRPHHPPRAGPVAEAAGRVRLGDAAQQPLGAGGVGAAPSWQGTQEAGHRGLGPQAAGALLGHAAGRQALACRAPGQDGGGAGLSRPGRQRRARRGLR